METRPIRFYTFRFEHMETGRVFINGAKGTTPCIAKALAVTAMEKYIDAKPELGSSSLYRLIEQTYVGLVPPEELSPTPDV